MKKRSCVKLVVIIVLFVLTILAMPLVLMKGESPESGEIRSRNTITVKGGIPDQQVFFRDFHIDRADDYRLGISILPVGVRADGVPDVNPEDLGFITAFLITNENDEVVYSSVQSAAYWDSVVYLEAGDYRTAYMYFTVDEEFQSFAQAQLCSIAESYRMTEDIGFENFAADSSTEFEYIFSYRPAEANSAENTIIVVLSLIEVMLLIFLVREIFLLSGGNNEKKYDERQLLEQGRGSRLGFLTLLAELTILMAFDSTGLIEGEMDIVLYGCSLFISLTVYAVYCIWHESYFSIGPDSKGVVIFMVFVFLFNLLICIVNGWNGLLIVNGKPTFRFINVFCCGTFLAMFVASLIRMVLSRRPESSEEEEDE